ncbi:MAG: hypothetical protein QNJ41_04925 [Xenococcaceae cyanobacterium MO_188.B32]|nr:hypothetical protein [Xenococcaceae cyanobacterium MO_188.B32]
MRKIYWAIALYFSIIKVNIKENPRSNYQQIDLTVVMIDSMLSSL